MPLDVFGRLKYLFFWRIVEEYTGHEWDLSGTYRIGDTGVEILNVKIEPAANIDPPRITSSTLRELRLSTLKAGIAAGIERNRQVAQTTADTIAHLESDEFVDETDKDRQLRDWRTVEAGLEAPALSARPRSGGRPPDRLEKWAARAETTLAALAGRQRLYEAHGAPETVDRETVKTWLWRMRQTNNPKDPRTGWLHGSGAGTMPGPRLLAWRADNP